jgi:BAR domain
VNFESLTLSVFLVFFVNFQMAELLAHMSTDSPLEDIVGKASAAERSESSSDGEKKTYTGVIDEWSKVSKRHADKFKTFALDYVAQWESTVATRIKTDTKETDKLRLDADHYKIKVESLEKQIQKLTSSNKPVPDATTEKLARNQEKLDEANTAYNRAAESLVALMDEVVDRSWRDLHPLLIKCLKFDMDVHADEAEILRNGMKVCVSDLLALTNAAEIKPRLDDIVKATPQELTTTTTTTTPCYGADDEVADNGVTKCSSFVSTDDEENDDDEQIPEQPRKSTSSSGSSVNPFDEESLCENTN